jgi:hypothetical protein
MWLAPFLYAKINEELYVSLLEGCKEYDDQGSAGELFGQLRGALYGTKQAAYMYEWRRNLGKFLKGNHFVACCLR